MIIHSFVAFSTSEIPEFIKECVISLFLECFYNGVHVLFGFEALDFLVLIQYLNINDSLTILYSCYDLLSDAVDNENYLHDDKVAE